MTNVIEIEGVGAAHAEKLSAAGLPTVEKLLSEGRTPAQREAIAERTGISEHLILRWVNHADLFRINGVAAEFAELLEAAGVDTVVELGHRNAAHLAAKLAEVNEKKHLTHRVPGESEVERWINEAKGLPREVSY